MDKSSKAACYIARQGQKSRTNKNNIGGSPDKRKFQEKRSAKKCIDKFLRFKDTTYISNLWYLYIFICFPMNHMYYI